MFEILTPEQMAAADRAAVLAGVPSHLLMERAGWAVADAAIRLAGGAYGRRMVIVCGKGNNAGDGFVAARYLKARGAHPVVIFPTTGSAGGLDGDAAANFSRLRDIRIRHFERATFETEARRASVVIDALVGTGLRGRLEGPMAEAVEAISSSGRPVVAVDIPSGVEGATGRIDGPAVKADVTVTMGALKCGLVFGPGSERTGDVIVAPIGIPPDALPRDLGLVEAADVDAILPQRPLDAHKRSVGTVLVVAGSVGMSGAAALTALAALRMGAGLVTIAAPASVALALDQTVLEATTLPLPETPRGTIEASAVDAVLERAETSSAVAMGPGLSRDPETVEFVRKVTAELETTLVLDADGINHFEGEAQALRARTSPTVMTPHPGEMARLIDSSTAAVMSDRLAAAREAASATGAVTLLKGYRTIVALPSGEAVVIPVGGPALATGGTGDVLTGMVAALAAAGVDAFPAASAAAFVHGAAGDRLAGRLGDRAVIASDLVEEIAQGPGAA